MKTKKQKILIKALHEFSKIHDVVDFGHLAHEDDIEPLKGLSLTKDRRDLYYAHGNIEHREISLLARQFSLKSSVRDEYEPHLWAIMRIRLDVSDVPRIFVDAHQAGNDIYSHYHTLLGQLKNVDHIVKETNTSFSSSFHVFTELSRVLDLESYLTDTFMQNMYMYFQGISVEMHDSHIYVYSENSTVTVKKLTKMLDALLWLAEHIEYADANLHRHTSVPHSSGVLSGA